MYFELQDFFGQVLCFLVVNIPPSLDHGIEAQSLVHAVINVLDHGTNLHHFYIRKKGCGPGETQVALGNFYSPKEYLALWAALGVLGVSGCLWMSLGIFERHSKDTPETSRDIQRHPETSRDIQKHPETPRDTQRHPETPRDTQRH